MKNQDHFVHKHHCNDVVQYISTWIPPNIYLKCRYARNNKHPTTGQLNFEFSIFVNHAHYDIRLGYFERFTDDFNYILNGKFKDKSFLYLVEGIETQAELCDRLVELRLWLEKNKLLKAPYSDSDFGYDYGKYSRRDRKEGLAVGNRIVEQLVYLINAGYEVKKKNGIFNAHQTCGSCGQYKEDTFLIYRNKSGTPDRIICSGCNGLIPILKATKAA